jgi:hypothetical protein
MTTTLDTYESDGNTYIQTTDSDFFYYDRRGYVLAGFGIEIPYCIGKIDMENQTFGNLSFRDLQVQPLSKDEEENEMKKFNCSYERSVEELMTNHYRWLQYCVNSLVKERDALKLK